MIKKNVFYTDLICVSNNSMQDSHRKKCIRQVVDIRVHSATYESSVSVWLKSKTYMSI